MAFTSVSAWTFPDCQTSPWEHPMRCDAMRFLLLEHLICQYFCAICASIYAKVTTQTNHLLHVIKCQHEFYVTLYVHESSSGSSGIHLSVHSILYKFVPVHINMDVIVCCVRNSIICVLTMSFRKFFFLLCSALSSLSILFLVLTYFRLVSGNLFRRNFAQTFIKFDFVPYHRMPEIDFIITWGFSLI